MFITKDWGLDMTQNLVLKRERLIYSQAADKEPASWHIPLSQKIGEKKTYEVVYVKQD